MKRTLQILSAFLPLTDALAQSEMGGSASATFDGSSPNPPKKTNASSENAGDEGDAGSDGSGDGSGGNLARGTGSPQSGPSSDTGEATRAAPAGGGSNSPQLQGSGDPGPMITHTPAANSPDYAPLDTQNSAHFLVGGSTVQYRSGSGSNSEADGDPMPAAGLTPAPDNSPSYDLEPLETDLSDADAMMILMGGIAMGAGEGAQSNGEVILDIVDYGPVTIGIGKATYSASGSEGAVADTFVDVEGADYVHTFGYNLNIGGTQSASTTYVIAIDFEGMSPSMLGSDQMGLSYYLALIGEQPNDGIDVDGNLSLFSLVADVQDDGTPAALVASGATAQDQGSVALVAGQSEQAGILLDVSASGVDTFVSANGSLVEIEDHFSSVSGAVTAVA